MTPHRHRVRSARSVHRGAGAHCMKPRLHLIGIFHTQHTAAYSHCAFTGKALRFPKMMQGQGYTVIEYSNAGSKSSAGEHVTMLDAAEFGALFQLITAAGLKRDTKTEHQMLAHIGAGYHMGWFLQNAMVFRR